MCVIIFAMNESKRYPFVLAANRDEYYERRTAPAGFWDDCENVIAGRDLVAGGTWLGVHTDGKIAAITNHYTHAPNNSELRSRGELVSRYLTGNDNTKSYARILDSSVDLYNGYGILFGNFSRILYRTNMEALQSEIRQGIHGLSNHFLNSSWPRVEKGKTRLGDLLSSENRLGVEPLFEILRDKSQSNKNTQYTEPSQNPIFVRTEYFGTRSSTVILVDHSNNVIFEERQFDHLSNRYSSTHRYEFQISQ